MKEDDYCVICSIVREEEKPSIMVAPYTVRFKEDAYSSTLGRVIKKGTLVTVHLLVCEDCAKEGNFI